MQLPVVGRWTTVSQQRIRKPPPCLLQKHGDLWIASTDIIHHTTVSERKQLLYVEASCEFALVQRKLEQVAVKCSTCCSESTNIQRYCCSWITVVLNTRAVETELKFRVPAPDIKSFWLRLQNDLVHGKLKTTVLFVQLACPTNCSLNGNPNSGSGSTIWKFLAPAPAIQNCLGSGSTALLSTYAYGSHSPVSRPNPILKSPQIAHGHHPLFQRVFQELVSANNGLNIVKMRQHKRSNREHCEVWVEASNAISLLFDDLIGHYSQLEKQWSKTCVERSFCSKPCPVHVQNAKRFKFRLIDFSRRMRRLHHTRGQGLIKWRWGHGQSRDREAPSTLSATA